jgi:hypothetical protein
VWTLRSYTDERDGSPTTHPFGTQPEGVLIYTEEGFVSAQLMNPSRGAARTADWGSGDRTDLADAAAGYIAYCGRFVVDELREMVTHIPLVALLPGLIGSDQHRAVVLGAHALTLRTEPRQSSDGYSMSSRLEWTRVSAQSACPSRAESPSKLGLERRVDSEVAPGDRKRTPRSSNSVAR